MIKYITILFLLFSVAASAQYVPNAGAYQYKGLKQVNSLQPPSTAGQPVTSINAPDSNYSALYYNKTDTTWYQFNPVSKLWSPFAGKIEIGTGDTVFVSSIDSIFITNTDSIFIVSGNDTIYIGDGPGPYASLYSGFGINIFDSSYNPAGPNAVIAVDTAGLTSWVTTIVQGDTTIINNNDSVSATFYVDTLANAPPASPVEGYKVLIGTNPTGAFAGHANEIATRVGSVWTFEEPEPNDVAIVDNSRTYATYQWNGTVWKPTSILWRTNLNRGLGNNSGVGTGDKRPYYLKAWNLPVVKIDTTRDAYFLKWSDLQDSAIYFRPGLNGKVDTGYFRQLVAGTGVTITPGENRTDTISTEGGGGSQNLQQVTEIGNTTTEGMHVDNESAEHLITMIPGEGGGGYLEVAIPSEGITTNIVPAQVQVQNGGTTKGILGLTDANTVGFLGLTNEDNFTGNVYSRNLTGNRSLELPNIGGTLAESVTVNSSTYHADANGNIDLGSIGGGGSGTVTDVTGTSPIVITGTSTVTPNVTINNAAADGTTKGAASFAAADFNASSGNISIDYTNGQKVSTTLPGFVTAGGSADKILHGDGTWKDTVPVVQFSGLTNRLPRWSSSINVTYFDSIFTNNTYTSFPRVGFGQVPQHTLSFDSSRSVAFTNAGTIAANSGIAMFFKRDTANSPVFRMGFSSLNGNFYINSVRPTGSGANSTIDINSAGFQTGGTVTIPFLSSSNATMNGVTNISNVRSASIGASSNTSQLFNTSFNISSGNSVVHDFATSIATTGTSGITIIRISPNLATVGSGTNRLFDVGTNSSTLGAGTHTSYFNISSTGTSTFTKPLGFTGSTPSNSAGTGAGTGPTISITGNDAAGYISIATGTSPTASGNIVTITFSTALANTPKAITLTPAGENAATEIAKFYVDQANTTSSAWIIKNTSSALTASTTYKFYYTVTQ